MNSFLAQKEGEKRKTILSTPYVCVDISPDKGHLTCGGGVSSDVMHLQWENLIRILSFET